MGPDTTVFRVEGSRSLQVFSEYLGIDTTTGSCPAAMSAQSPDLWSPVAIRRRVLPLCRHGTPLVAERVVRRDERAGTELETAAARAERTGVHGVVPDHVEEPGTPPSRPVVSGDRQGPTVGRARRTGQRGEVPEGDVAEHLDHVRRTQMPLEHLLLDSEPPSPGIRSSRCAM